MARERKQVVLLREVGARLREVRRARGETQARVAEGAGLDPQSVQRAEQGKVALSLVRLHAIASYLGITMSEIFEDVGKPVPATPWDPQEAAVLDLWHRIDSAKRGLVLRVLEVFTGD
jgi:transcriptional regulator with XRE-family HTH domain